MTDFLSTGISILAGIAFVTPFFLIRVSLKDARSGYNAKRVAGRDYK
jgi:hypothetical protein